MKTIYLSALLLIGSVVAQAQSARFPDAAPQSGVIIKKAAANRAAINTKTTAPSAATPHSTHHQCGQDATLNYMRSINPNYDAELRQLQRGIEMAAMQDNSAARSPQAVIEIPVVFHVIHNGEAVGTGRNISLARINAQLALLNSDIRKLNGNFNSGTPNVFKAAAADVEIRFCLAKTDPAGATTTGITRANLTDPVDNNDTETRIKPAQKWDVTRYLNIYILPIPGTNQFGGTIGYSYIPTPGLIGNVVDGIVIDYRWVGGAGVSGFSGGGRSLTHEVGHYFGLPHIWADVNNTGGCAADDGIADTPEQDDATSNNAAFQCSSGVPPVSCGTQNMYVNYMDYLDDDACYTMFTTGQKNVMRSVLTGTGANFGLANRSALVNNGLTQCSACNMTASVTTTSVTCTAAGTATTTVQNPAGTPTYAWSNGATTANLTTTVAGTYTITVTGTGGCIATATAIIANTCTTTCDTLLNYDTAVDSLRLYGSGTAGNGYISGNNQYNDRAKAEFFDYTGGANSDIKGVYIGFGRAKDSGTPNNVTINVWNSNGTAGAPSTILGSRTVTIASIATKIAANNFFQYYEFTNPIPLPANKKFYVGVTLPTTAGDTIALITNQTGVIAAGAGTAWEQASDATWHNYSDPNAGWGVELRHLIGAVIGTNTTASFTKSVNTIACGAANLVTLNSTASTNASIRQWSIQGGTPATSTAVSPTASWATGGTFTIRLITTSGCISDTATSTIVVTCASCNLTATTTAQATTCGLANGGVSVTATGGTAPYTYAWSSGGFTTATAGPVAAGTYTVTVTGGAGCTRTATGVVATSVPLTATTTAQATTCGNANGGVSVTATGGTAPYTYAWSSGGFTTATAGPVAAGTYTVTVTGGAGCTRTATGVVATSTGLTLTPTVQAPACGSTNGGISITATGGTTYTYAWSNPAFTTATAGPLAAGTYTVTVTSANGCTKSTSVVVACVTATQNTIAGVQNFVLYPNPSTGQALVSADFATATVVNIEVFNSFGQSVWQQKTATAVTHLAAYLELQNQASGVYFVNIRTAEGSMTRLLSLQNK